MNEILFQILFDTEVLKTATSSSGDNGPFLWLAGPIGAIGFYTIIFMRYRNTNKRHEYESKTASEMGKVTAFDQKVGSVRGVERTTIVGENNTKPRTRLGQRSTFVESWKS